MRTSSILQRHCRSTYFVCSSHVLPHWGLSLSIPQLPSAFPLPSLSPDLSSLRSDPGDPAAAFSTTSSPAPLGLDAASSPLSVSAPPSSSTPPWGQLSGSELRAWAASKLQRARELFQMGVAVDHFHGPLYHAYGNMELVTHVPALFHCHAFTDIVFLSSVAATSQALGNSSSAALG